MSFSGNKITEKNLGDQIGSPIDCPKLFDLEPIENKRVEASFTAPGISSDGGVLLIKDIERRPGIGKAPVYCLAHNHHQN